MHTVKDAVGEYLMAHKHHSINTQKNNKQRLGVFSLWCEQKRVTLESLRSSHIRLFLDDIKARPGLHGNTLKDSSVRAYGKAVKALISWLASEDEYDIAASVASKVSLPRIEQTIVETFSKTEIADLFRACEKMPYPIRDRAILSVLCDCGLRASELCGLLLPEDSYILVRHTKSKRDREVPCGRQTRLALKKYLRVRKPAHKNEQYVFLGHTGRMLTRGGLFQICVAIGECAGVKNCHPHRFRNFFATQYLLNNNGDIYRLSKLLGHTSVKVTERYTSSITSRQARQGGESVLDRLKKDL